MVLSIVANYVDLWQEVRERILRCLALWAALFCVCFYFRYELLSWCKMPVSSSARSLPPVVSMSLVDGFYITFELSFYLSFLLSVPFFVYQVWCFLQPALFARERLMLSLLCGVGTLLFFVGVMMGWLIILPLVLAYARFFLPQDVIWLLELRQYVSLFWQIGLYSGLVLELPLMVFLLTYYGVVRAKYFSLCRPYVLLGCFIAGMLATPPDMFAQIMFALPLYLLFELGYGLSLFVNFFLVSRKPMVSCQE